MKRNWFYQYLLMQCIALAVTSESYYSINAPGVIKSNRVYSVVVALHETSGPCSIRVGIQGPNFNEFRDVNLQPFELKQIEFLPKKLIIGDYNLYAEGLAGLSFKNTSRLNIQPVYGPKMYIQTDKAIYKSQDLVKFRIVILDEHTRPLNIEEPVHVDILNSEGNRVKQIKDISFIHGVYTGQFKLSKFPVLGIWQIKVVLGGRYAYSKIKNINIDNYILPKFSVYLKTPSDIVLKDGYIKVVIYGKYTFEKYVKGKATVELWNDYPKVLLQTQHVDIENLGFVEFNIKNETAYGLIVKANLTEMHTGRTEIEVQNIRLHSQHYYLKVPYNEIEFENNKPYRLKVNVKHWTGAPVLDHNTPVTMEHGNKVYESFLDENGAATFEFEHDESANHKFQFKDSIGMLPNIYTSANLLLNNREYYCRLKLVDEKLKLEKPVQIEVISILSIPYLMYTIMSHASLVHSEYIKVPPNQKSHIISITPSVEMIPESFIYVYYIQKGNLRYEEMRLNFPNEFANQISLSALKKVKPGEEVTITINAQPKSYVSIMAVDLGVYLLDDTFDLNRDDILSDLINERSYSPMAAEVYPGIISGLLTLTNAQYPFKNRSVNVVSGYEISSLHNFRQKFPETWIFDNFVINETNTKLTLPIPDAITTWRITAFTNNDVTGFGIVRGPTDITTIQPFFISLNLPFSAKRGEIVSIPVTIFNYLDQSLDTEVVLYNNDQEFYFMESTIQGAQKSNDSKQQTKLITIPADEAKTVNFLIYPIQVGELSLGIAAYSSLYSDAVLQKLKVDPEGVPKQKSQALYLSIPAGEKIFSSFSIEELVDSVPDSDYITFSVGGHYLVPTLENFQDLIQMPTGCGEQNMVNFAPSILILQYLKANGKLSKEKVLVESLRSAMEVAYQQQLSFRLFNGGYSVFGLATDEEASTWLTAYVVRYFIKASEFLDIETRIIDSALEYLCDQQKANGEFLHTGYILKPNHKNAYGLTAFALLAFLENEKYAMKYQKTIQNGVEFLYSNLSNTIDVYILSLMSTVFNRAKHQYANSLIKQLKSLGKEDNGLKWWSANDHNLANDIEITAYAAISLLDTPGDHTSILKWLIEQRNANGGFISSHDTVVGMEALVKFSEIYRNVKKVNLNISYIFKDQEGIELGKDDIYVDSNNILDLQKHELPITTRHITFEMQGNGASLVQFNHQYNIVNMQEFRHFTIQIKPIYRNAEEINLEICFSYQTDSDMFNQTTNMVIMEINLPSGFRSEAKNDMILKQKKFVQRIESANSESTIILYLDKLEANTKHCLEIPVDKTNDILMPKPAAIIMYDYYNLSRSNTEFYTL
ncbi:thioester-containing protein 1 allele S3-like [Calliphora vicina]|uniref:thioester-containing protein 1 allele S3-like n=1 Tax=Calliphora vicina TaxID=7373 RepID=UPI00325AB68A